MGRWSASVRRRQQDATGTTYTEFLLAELGREHERRASLQARAASLGGFGTGAVGLAGGGLVVAFGSERTLSAAASMLLLMALASFLGSTALAVYVFSIGRKYRVAHNKMLSQMVNARWADGEVTARRAVATLAAKTVATLRAGNNRSANWVLVAGWVQIAGLSLVVAALALEFARG